MIKNKVEQLKEMMKAKKDAEEKAKIVEQKVEEAVKDQAETDEISAQIKAAEDEAKAHYDKLLRVMAEFENFKKRIERERLEQTKYSNQSLIHDLLPVIDDLDRVLEHLPKEPTPEVTAIADGVKIVQNHFSSALSKHGLLPLESALGKPFDPGIHEAVAHVENGDSPDGTVIMEHRKGWKLHDRILRATMVTVAKAPSEKKN